VLTKRTLSDARHAQENRAPFGTRHRHTRGPTCG
jgi:hypothetical protein